MGYAMYFIKAKLLLLSVALVWGALIVLMLPFQLTVTIAGIHPKRDSQLNIQMEMNMLTS